MTEGKAAADPPHHLRLGGYHHVPCNVAHVSQNRVWRDIDEKVEFPTDWMQQPIVGGKAGTHPCKVNRGIIASERNFSCFSAWLPTAADWMLLLPTKQTGRERVGSPCGNFLVEHRYPESVLQTKLRKTTSEARADVNKELDWLISTTTNHPALGDSPTPALPRTQQNRSYFLCACIRNSKTSIVENFAVAVVCFQGLDKVCRFGVRVPLMGFVVVHLAQ